MTAHPSRSDAVHELLFAVLAADDQEAALRELGAQHEPDVVAQVRATLLAFRRTPPVDAGTGAPADADDMPERLGHLRLLRRLGAGGMGVVYLARDEQLGREVAVKVIRPEMVFFPGQRERFRREVAVVARLKHPAIVPVYSVGESDGVPYFTMEHVEGISLGALLANLRGRAPVTLRAHDLFSSSSSAAPSGDGRNASTSALTSGTWPAACVQLVRQIADALVHAHEAGVLHRDLKPSNVLLGRDGRPRLVDFGLAHAEDDQDLTRSGAQIGSLPYIPPEFLGTERMPATPQADVYSLGVTLYELLTLVQPFYAETIEATTLAIRLGGPRPPRVLNRAITWDLETVCLKAMDRSPARRYPTAAAFRADLDNLLARRPIHARRASAALRARRWVQRHPTATVGIALGTLAFVVAPALLVWHQARALAEQRALRAAADQRTYEASVLAADQSLRAHRGAEALANLELAPEALRGFEWRHLRLHCDSSVASLPAADGPANDAAFLAGGSLLVAGSDGALRRYAAPWREPAAVLRGSGQALVALDVTGGDVGFTVAAGGELRRWNLGDGTSTVLGHHENADALAVAGDGATVATRSPTSGIAVWRPPYGRALTTFGALQPGPIAFAGVDRLLAATKDGTVQLWDTAASKVVRDYAAAFVSVTSIVPLPAGDTFLTAGNDTALRLWRLDQEQPARVIGPHPATFATLARSGDGHRVYGALQTGTVVVRDGATLDAVSSLHGHPTPVRRIAAAGDGETVATVGADGSVRLWQPLRRAPVRVVAAHHGAVRQVAALDDGRAVSVGSDGRLCVIELATLRAVAEFAESDRKYRSLALAPDRARFVTGTSAGTLELWEAAGPRCIARLAGHAGEVHGMAWDPRGNRFASAGADGRLLLWEAGRDQPLRALAEGHAPFTALAFAPGGERLAAVARDGTVELFDLAGGAPRLLGRHDKDAQGVAFDPAGTRVASCGLDDTVRVFATDGRELARFEWPDQNPQTVLFDADGARLFAGGLGRRIRVWNLASGRPLLTLEGHTRGVFALSWTPDHRRLLSSGWDGTVRVWEGWP